MTEYQKKEIKYILDKKGYTLAIAESLTSGLVQSAIASVSGSSSFYLGGITAYTIDAKVKFLGVNREHATKVNAVSDRVVSEMAMGISNAFGADVGISTTGFAEASEDLGVDIPYAYIAVYIKNEDILITKKVIGENMNRNEMRQYVANLILSLLLEQITISE